MTLLVVSFLAGVLTVMAPCILPLLPVIIGGSIATGSQKSWYRPLVIVASLALSIVVFTLLLKASTTLLGVPAVVWKVVSGGIVIALGLTLAFPTAWEKLSTRLRLGTRANGLLYKAFKHKGRQRDVLTGAALGPVFSSCSPTYALIVATVIPQSFAVGLAYLLAYAAGLAATLLLIALLGQPLATRLAKVSDPKGRFMRGIGIAFVLVGIAVVFGLDHRLQTYVLDKGWYDPISNLETSLPR